MRTLCRFLTLLLALSSSADPVRHTVAPCGVSFEVPSSWLVKVEPKTPIWRADFTRREIRCSIGIKPPGWDRERRHDDTGLLRPYPIELIVVHASFAKAAKNAGFTKSVDSACRGTCWTMVTRAGENRAEESRTACCQILIGDTWGHVSTRDGDVATATETIAVVNDRQGNSAILDGENADRFRPSVNGIAASLRFEPASR